MKTIAKVIESMLTKDATQQWTGQTSAVGSRDHWSWTGFAELSLPISRIPPAPPQRPTKGMIMKTIAKVIESMLTKDATQQWTGQTSAVGSRDHWSWTGFGRTADLRVPPLPPRG